MSLMEKRLQLLLDRQRYDRIASEAARSGLSVAAVIRHAIDVCYPSGDDSRSASLTQFLELTAEITEPRQTWQQMKAAGDDALDRELSR